jgi:hypothetical protein
VRTIGPCPEHPGCVLRTVNGLETHEDMAGFRYATEAVLKDMVSTAATVKKQIDVARRDIGNERAGFEKDLAAFHRDAGLQRAQVVGPLAILRAEVSSKVQEIQESLDGVAALRQTMSELEEIRDEIGRQVQDLQSAAGQVHQAKTLEQLAAHTAKLVEFATPKYRRFAFQVWRPKAPGLQEITEEDE